MLKWSARAQKAVRKLFEPLQDIDVYVEDKGDEAFYKWLFNSATGNSIKIAKIFPLDGRDNVVNGARKHDFNKRRALYIIDGDLPWVKGILPPRIPGLHQNDAYCIENLLFCSKALVSIISQDCAILEEEAEKRLSYDVWLESLKQPLTELFSAFATAHDFSPSTTTVAQGVGNMCTVDKAKKVTRLDHAKVHTAWNAALDAAINSSSLTRAKERYHSHLERISTLPRPLDAVSGKDFLLPLLMFHLHSIGCKIPRKALRIRLASSGDMARFADLFASLKKSAQGAH